MSPGHFEPAGKTALRKVLADALIDSPSNAEVVVSDEVAENLTYGADTVKSLDLIPAEVILDNRDSWLDQWNAKVAN